MAQNIYADDLYINYDVQNAIKYHKASEALSLFSAQYNGAREALKDTALASQLMNLRHVLSSRGQKAASGINLLGQLGSGNLLEQIYEALAQGMNKAVNNAHSTVNLTNYDQVISNVSNLNFSALRTGYLSTDTVDSFFNLILQGVQMAGKFNVVFLDQLTDIGKYLTGNTEFTINQSWRKKATIQQISASDMEMARQIIDYLSNAVERFQASSYTNSSGALITKSANTLDPRSFASTVTNIFSTVIGERVAQRLLSFAIKNGIDQCDEAVQEILRNSGLNGHIEAGRGLSVLGGTQRDISSRVSKVDVFNSRAFKLTATVDDTEASVDLSANTSVKWYQNFNQDTSTAIHIIQGSSLGRYLPDARGLAYNTIVHRNSSSEFYEAYRALRASISASFFSEWLTGTGNRLSIGRMNINSAQFLLVNGQFYSMMTIIRNLCDDLASRGATEHSRDMPFNFRIPNVNNEWRGNRNPNVHDAIERSRSVAEIIEKLSISATFNSNMLARYV